MGTVDLEVFFEQVTHLKDEVVRLRGEHEKLPGALEKARKLEKSVAEHKATSARLAKELEDAHAEHASLAEKKEAEWKALLGKRDSALAKFYVFSNSKFEQMLF